MEFTENEKDILVASLSNYHEVIQDALNDGGKMSQEYYDYFTDRLIIVEYLIGTIDPEMKRYYERGLGFQ